MERDHLDNFPSSLCSTRGFICVCISSRVIFYILTRLLSTCHFYYSSEKEGKKYFSVWEILVIILRIYQLTSIISGDWGYIKLLSHAVHLHSEIFSFFPWPSVFKLLYLIALFFVVCPRWRFLLVGTILQSFWGERNSMS